MKTLVFLIFLFTTLIVNLPIYGSPNFSYEYLENQRISTNQIPSTGIETRNSIQAWKNQNPHFQNLPYPTALKIKDKQLNRALFEKAKNAIELCIAQIRQAKSNSALIKKQGFEINEEIWWKKVENKDKVNRRLSKENRKKALALVSHSSIGITALDKIDDQEISNSPSGLQMYRILFRYHISNQLALHQYEKALNTLIRLRRINDLKPDPVMHYYFLQCYEYKLNISKKNTGISDESLRAIRKKKNKHLELAIKTRFGINSPELKKTLEFIKHDELGSPRN